ncbi:MAG TPA: TonB-dependent receptor, partial [Bacteroidetes bacterium]|nr:TonB-dependent receptor [Bacteroidota bacterium]
TNIGFRANENGIVLYKKPPRKYTVSGYVRDEKSGEGLVLASVWDAHSGKGTTTNDYGFYSLELSEGEAEMKFSYLGYQLYSKNISINVELSPSLRLNEVIVAAENLPFSQHRFLLGKGIGVSSEEIQQTPSLAGEADLFRFMQLQPGVQSGADGFSGIHVRGGNADQNLVLLDGVPVYNPSHTLGLFSIFNVHTIKSARLLKGGFSAKYGGRLSSVIDVRTKEGNTKKTGFVGAIGTLATKVILEGPLVKEKAGFVVSIRRTHIDPIVELISKRKKRNNFETGQTNYYFYDINAKAHARLSKKNRVFFSFYKGADNYFNKTNIEDFFADTLFTYSNAQKLNWGNTISALRWNRLYNDKLFSNTTFTFSKYNYASRNGILNAEISPGDTLNYNYFTSFQSLITDTGVKTDFEYYISDRHQLSFGAGALMRRFEPGSFGADDEQLNNIEGINRIETFEDFDDEAATIFFPKKFNAQELYFYCENKIKVSKALTLLAGLHTAAFLTNEKNYSSWQPRISVRYKAPKIFGAALSLSRMTQFLHVLTTSGNGFPNDLWVPSTLFVEPEQSWQATAAVSTDTGNGINAKAEIYYKKMNNLISYPEGAGLPGLVDNNPAFWEEEITVGEGRSYGFEFQLQKVKARTRGWLSYTLSYSRRRFPNINNGNEYPYRYLHRHALNINISHYFTETISLNTGWQYGSGQRITLVKSDAPFAPLDNLLGNVVDPQGTTNGTLLPKYHRLDISLNFFWNKKKIKHHLSIGAYNIYNRPNPYYIYLLEDDIFPDDNGLKKQRALPVFPSVSYRVVY